MYEGRVEVRVSVDGDLGAGVVRRPVLLAVSVAAAFWMLFEGGGAPARGATAVHLVSRAADGSGPAETHSNIRGVTPNGQFVLIESSAGDLFNGHIDNGAIQIFLHDRISKTTELVSHGLAAPLSSSDSNTGQAFVSDDGRWVAFESDAIALAFDGNSSPDVFLHDSVTKSTTLVSRSAADAMTTAFGSAQLWGLSADGRFVLFSTNAADAFGIGTDTNNATDLLLFDRLGGTRLVSHAAGSDETIVANDAVFSAALSADGGWVAYATYASNAVPGVTDVNGGPEVILWERAAAPESSARLVSRSKLSATTAVGGSLGAIISADGGEVVFSTLATNVEGSTSDSNSATDLYHFDRDANLLRLVTHADASQTVTANGDPDFGYASMSADGERVAYGSLATDVVANVVDDNDVLDVFLWTRTSNTNALVSHAAGDAEQVADAVSYTPVISLSGDAVAFKSLATDLVAGQVDENGLHDLFLYNRHSTTTVLASPKVGSEVETGVGVASNRHFMGLDPGRVFFDTYAADLLAVDGNNAGDVVYFGPSEVFTSGFGSGGFAGWGISPP